MSTAMIKKQDEVVDEPETVTENDCGNSIEMGAEISRESR